jgi:hypothetical protein
VLWAVSEHDKRTPLDPDPVPDGTLVIVDRNEWGTPLVAYVPPDQLLIDDPPRYRSHFATCPDAEAWRQPR